MNLLVDTTPHYNNMGDLAMLQVCVRRLRALWPASRLFIFTADPDGLISRFPDVEPIVADGRDLWFAHAADPLRLPANHRGTDMRSLLRHNISDPDLELVADFLDVLAHSDLLVFTGMGAFADSFEAGVLPMLNTIPLAHSLGVPVVAFGQGIGPVRESSPLWTAMQTSMPLLALIALREQVFGPGILQSLKVQVDRTTITGDDAVELAFDTNPPSMGNAIGVNFRLAPYSGVTTSAAQTIACILRDFAKHQHAPILPVSISMVSWESDCTAFADVLPELAASSHTPASPADVISQIDKCRVVVTGSYHGAVFALSRGVPALCLTKSAYYTWKFRGLAEMFGNGCIVIDIDEGNKNILDALKELWTNAAEHRTSLVQAARRQMDSARAAYATLSRFTSSEANREWKRATAFPDLLTHWYKRRISVLQAELGRTRADLRKIEEARDWHKDQADGARRQLAETTHYLHQVEEARDWHRNRAEALERQYNALIK